jgi:hypothetical protein
MSVDETASMFTSSASMNVEQRRQIKDLTRRIGKADDAIKMNDLINEYSELFELIPTAKLSKLHKVSGYMFYKRSNQTYFSKQPMSPKTAITELQAEVTALKRDVDEIKSTLTQILTMLHVVG